MSVFAEAQLCEENMLLCMQSGKDPLSYLYASFFPLPIIAFRQFMSTSAINRSKTQEYQKSLINQKPKNNFLT